LKMLLRTSGTPRIYRGFWGLNFFSCLARNDIGKRLRRLSALLSLSADPPSSCFKLPLAPRIGSRPNGSNPQIYKVKFGVSS